MLYACEFTLFLCRGRMNVYRLCRRSGYLRKRRETDRWLKRWCVLTETCLMYFHKPNDQHPSKIVQVTFAISMVVVQQP